MEPEEGDLPIGAATLRPAPAALAPFLASNRFFPIIPIYTFALKTGEVLRYSGYAAPFTLGPALFDSASLNANGGTFVLGPRFGPALANTKIGVQTDTIEIKIFAGGDDKVGSLTWQQAFRAGVFDGADVEVDRVVCEPNPGQGVGTAVGAVVWFLGYVGEVEIGRTAITVRANSMLGLLSVQYPRRLWQHTCSHVFGDAMCQFDRSTMAAAVMAQGGSEQFHVVTGFNPSPANLYDNGTIIAESGTNAGYTRTIALAGQGDGVAYLTTPFIYPVAEGDVFSMLPGCDHQILTCQNYFNNLAHYGGQNWIPPSEFSI